MHDVPGQQPPRPSSQRTLSARQHWPPLHVNWYVPQHWESLWHAAPLPPQVFTGEHEPETQPRPEQQSVSAVHAAPWEPQEGGTPQAPPRHWSPAQQSPVELQAAPP